ncbi:hypothetical protein Cva_00548 [Caedimonas varicaedens]|uniref:Uncharacterized protein n=1 Tax=Caedimonas varicaedens TaxID=1629334 RepID=A0A0K8MBQ6_9PROT|nr:hypothetical protein Cva_00548 [Caedimonas varicaedens]
MPQPIPLKQNTIWLRTLCGLIDEGSFITSVDLQSRGDTLTVSLVARQREGNKAETTDTMKRLKKSLNRWQGKVERKEEGAFVRLTNY